MQRRWRLSALALAPLALLCAMGVAALHPAVSAVATIRISRDGHVELLLRHDALAFALNELPARIADEPMRELLDGTREDMDAAFADARQRLSAGVRLTVDGAALALAYTELPTTEAVLAWKRDNPGGILPLTLTVAAEATLPSGAPPALLRIRFPQVLGECMLIVEKPGAEPLALPLAAGEESPAFDIRFGPVPGGPPGSAEPDKAEGFGAWGGWRVGLHFFKLGFTHIIPGGPDHALFVLGLFLLSPRLKSVLWQISAFTVAHTVTLTLTSLRIIGLPDSVVEPAIAASIAFVAVENLLTSKLHPWRPAVAFLFGLVHGMGVATVFNDEGVPPGQLVQGLAAFTVGVEAGHVAVLLAAFVLLGWAREKPWYRSRVAIPLSIAIAVVAVFWLMQRLS